MFKILPFIEAIFALFSSQHLTNIWLVLFVTDSRNNKPIGVNWYNAPLYFSSKLIIWSYSIFFSIGFIWIYLWTFLSVIFSNVPLTFVSWKSKELFILFSSNKKLKTVIWQNYFCSFINFFFCAEIAYWSIYWNKFT